MNTHFLKLTPACALLLAASLATPLAWADRGPGNRGQAGAESGRMHRDGGGRDARGDHDRGQRADRDRDRDRDHRGERGDRHDDDRDRSARRDDDRDRRGDRHFDERRQRLVRDYYGDRSRGFRCPPGLSKRHNGCMPPGQARRWQIGHVLPREVIFYDLEPTLLLQFGPPPSRHRYVRVAGDILLIAIGTGLVIDAIEDLGSM